MLPWCATICSSPIFPESWWASLSTSLRVLTNSSVVRCPLVNSTMRSRVRSHRSWDAIGPSSSSFGISMPRSISRPWPVSTIEQSGAPFVSMLSVPTRNFPISSMGFCVADRPMRVIGSSDSSTSRSIEMLRCDPRLSSATACNSSTMSVLTLLSPLRPLSEVSRIKNDSGVVTSTCGGFFAILCRSLWGVSPVRTATRMSGSGVPRASARSCKSRKGDIRLR